MPVGPICARRHEPAQIFDQQGIKLLTFSYWCRKLGKSTTPSCPGFVELERPAASCSGLEVVFPNGVVVRVIRDLALVRELVTL